LKDIDATPTLVCDQGSNVLLAGRLMRWFKKNCAAHVFNLAIASDGFKRIPTRNAKISHCFFSSNQPRFHQHKKKFGSFWKICL
jgi:cytidylate kinase